uniref:Uncharacterized protein n=1 Tax=Pipistrellus kuhlii TaxID=59472 RepID=A0A7J7VB86_PIPKU|nr:hypothetical protein mPipKuh1_008466 [Pipistrellus kuhlii]
MAGEGVGLSGSSVQRKTRTAQPWEALSTPGRREPTPRGHPAPRTARPGRLSSARCELRTRLPARLAQQSLRREPASCSTAPRPPGGAGRPQEGVALWSLLPPPATRWSGNIHTVLSQCFCTFQTS